MESSSTNNPDEHEARLYDHKEWVKTCMWGANRALYKVLIEYNDPTMSWTGEA